MAEIWFTKANQYARMADSFYMEYQSINEEYQMICEKLRRDIENASLATSTAAMFSVKEEKAIATVVFQALAIEAYVNLLGMVCAGEAFNTSCIERKSVTVKLNFICEEYFGKKYPEDHANKIKELFDKRHKLVHPKTHSYPIIPKPYDYVHPENNYKDVEQIMNESLFAFDNLEEEMALYSELQEQVRIIRNAEKELIEEIGYKQVEQNDQEIKDMIDEMVMQ